MCYPDGDFLTGDSDVHLGDLQVAEMEPIGFWMSVSQYEYWRHTHLTVDVVKGRGSGFSVEAPEGVRFLIRSRLFTDEEWLAPRGLTAIDPTTTRPPRTSCEAAALASDQTVQRPPARDDRAGGRFPFTRRTLPAFRALLLMERRAAVREASVTTGGAGGGRSPSS